MLSPLFTARGIDVSIKCLASLGDQKGQQRNFQWHKASCFHCGQLSSRGIPVLHIAGDEKLLTLRKGGGSNRRDRNFRAQIHTYLAVQAYSNLLSSDQCFSLSALIPMNFLFICSFYFSSPLNGRMVHKLPFPRSELLKCFLPLSWSLKTNKLRRKIDSNRCHKAPITHCRCSTARSCHEGFLNS